MEQEVEVEVDVHRVDLSCEPAPAVCLRLPARLKALLLQNDAAGGATLRIAGPQVRCCCLLVKLRIYVSLSCSKTSAFSARARLFHQTATHTHCPLTLSNQTKRRSSRWAAASTPSVSRPRTTAAS